MTHRHQHTDRAASSRRPGSSWRRSAAAVVTVALLSACAPEEPAPTGQSIPGTRPGYELLATADRPDAPDVGLWPTVADPDAEVSFDDLAGDVVVVNFWASWCGPCRDEQPDLNDAHDQLADLPVEWLGVAFREDPRANAAAHQREFDVPYPSVYDPENQIAAAWDVTAIPFTVILDSGGRIAARLFGVTTAEEVVAIATRLSAEAG